MLAWVVEALLANQTALAYIPATVQGVNSYYALVLVPVLEVRVEEGIRYWEVFPRLATLALPVAVASSSCWSGWAQAKIQVEDYLPSLLAQVHLLHLLQSHGQVPFHDWGQTLARVLVLVLVLVLVPSLGVVH